MKYSQINKTHYILSEMPDTINTASAFDLSILELS